MGVTGRLSGRSVFIDTAPLIYFIESSSEHQSFLRQIFEGIANGQIPLSTSVLTLMEVLVQPLKKGRADLAEQYERILTSTPNFAVHEIDATIVRTASRLRAELNLTTPDAIQVATAMERGAEFLLTNDKGLKRVKGIDVLVLSEV